MKERIAIVIALVLAFMSGAALYHYYLQLSQIDSLAEQFVQRLDDSLINPTTKKYDDTLPNLLIIGDSISKGYLPPLERILIGKINVESIGDNARDTRYTLNHIRRWLQEVPRPDLIVFNNGLHDLKYVDQKGITTDSSAGELNVSVEAYRENMDGIVAILKETEATIIFATTTPVPESVEGYIAGSEVAYNNTAIDIVKRHGVLICDLHTLAAPLLPIIQQSRGIHFNPIGSWILAEGVAAVILSQSERL
jgi:acyl-CoA thioesterase-1